MLISENQIFVCPYCKENVRSVKQSLQCQNQHVFDVSENEFIDLTWPKDLSGSDATFFEQYKEIANFYDKASNHLFSSFYTDEIKERKDIASKLNANPGDRILELSTGTGLNIENILNQIAPSGELYALDLSPAMLKKASEKTYPSSHNNLKFIVANASYLPFEDNYFDALFHIGGINTFTEIEKALAEIVRVVKPGGKVVISDEGLAPWLLDTEYGNQLVKMNALYKIQPPIDKLPQNITDVKLSWVVGNAFYVLEFVVSEKELKINSNQPDM